MKKSVILIIALIWLLHCGHNSYCYNGDLTLSTPVGIEFTYTIQIVSIPFEGLTFPAYYPCNPRLDEIFNGYIHRRFCVGGTETVNGDISYYQFTGSSITLNSCMREDWGQTSSNAFWGFARYKITMQKTGGPTYYCYWNSLDSKYGKEHFPNQGQYYFTDWCLTYVPELQAFILSGSGITYDTLYLSDNGREYKMWQFGMTPKKWTN